MAETSSSQSWSVSPRGPATAGKMFPPIRRRLPTRGMARPRSPKTVSDSRPGIGADSSTSVVDRIRSTKAECEVDKACLDETFDLDSRIKALLNIPKTVSCREMSLPLVVGEGGRNWPAGSKEAKTGWTRTTPEGASRGTPHESKACRFEGKGTGGSQTRRMGWQG